MLLSIFVKRKAYEYILTSVGILFCTTVEVAQKNKKEKRILQFRQGLVAFSSQGDRIALTQIEQLTDNHYVKLGYYDTQADNLTWLERERWVGTYLFVTF